MTRVFPVAQPPKHPNLARTPGGLGAKQATLTPPRGAPIMPIQFHCEGCVSDVSFTSPNPNPSLAARDELAAMNYLTQQHATCQQSMLALRESQASAAGANMPAAAQTSGSPNGAQPVAQTFSPAPVAADVPPAATLPVSRVQ